MHTITNAYLSVDVPEQSLKHLQQTLKSALQAWGLETTPNEGHSESRHISLAYVLGSYELGEIEEIVRRLSRKNLNAEIIGIEILEGLTTPYDYVTLTLAPSENLEWAANAIECELEVKHFEQSFNWHLSLMRIPKGSIKRELRGVLADYLQSRCEEELAGRTVCGQAISVFDAQKHRKIQVLLST